MKRQPEAEDSLCLLHCSSTLAPGGATTASEMRLPGVEVKPSCIEAGQAAVSYGGPSETQPGFTSHKNNVCYSMDGVYSLRGHTEHSARNGDAFVRKPESNTNGEVCRSASNHVGAKEIFFRDPRALKECVCNLRHVQHSSTHDSGHCGCPVLMRSAACTCCAVRTTSGESHASSLPQPIRKPLKSLLKHRDPSSRRPKRNSRVRFSDTLTVFSEEFPEAQLYVIRTAELTFAEVCSMYEPPPEYQDLLPFEPPDGYKDDSLENAETMDTTPLVQCSVIESPAVEERVLVQTPEPIVVVTPETNVVPVTSAPESREQNSAQKPVVEANFVITESSCSENVSETLIDKSVTPVDNTPVLSAVEITSPPAEDVDPLVAELHKQLEDSSTVVEADLSELLPQEVKARDEAPSETCQEDEKPQEVHAPCAEMEDLPLEEQETSAEEEKNRVVTEFLKTTVFENNEESQSKAADDDDDDDDREGEEEENDEDGEEEEDDDEEESPSSVTEESPKGDDRQDDSDSSADSQDTIIMMTTEESKKNEEHIKESMKRYVDFRKKVATSDRSPSDTSSVSSSTSQDSDGSLRSSESSSSTSEDRSESPSTIITANGGGSASSAVEAADLRQRTSFIDDNEDDESNSSVVMRTNSQIRKTIERTAMRRSMTRVTDVRKRYSSTPNLAKSPTSASQDSLVEKLRWLTSLDDENNPTDKGTESEPETGVTMRHPRHPPPVPYPPEAFRQDAGRALPSAYNRSQPFYQRSGVVGQRPASFSQFSDSRSASLTMIPVAARDYRMIRRVPGESHPDPRPQQNRVTVANEQYYQQSPPPPPPLQRRHLDGEIRKDSPDELERFVQQDMERIERIRKRYSLTEEEDPSFGFARRPSVRGIRPRFGSTTEILKEMQAQLGPPPTLASPMNVIGSHLSWSPPVSSGNVLIDPEFMQKTPQQVKVMLLPRVAEEDPHVQEVQTQKPATREQRTYVYGSTGDLSLLSRTRRLREVFPPPSSSSPSSSSSSSSSSSTSSSTTGSVPGAKDERGAPEGASSSPKVSSDSLYHGPQPPTLQQNTLPTVSESPPKQGIVYYSLNV